MRPVSRVFSLWGSCPTPPRLRQRRPSVRRCAVLTVACVRVSSYRLPAVVCCSRDISLSCGCISKWILISETQLARPSRALLQRTTRADPKLPSSPLVIRPAITVVRHPSAHLALVIAQHERCLYHVSRDGCVNRAVPPVTFGNREK